VTLGLWRTRLAPNVAKRLKAVHRVPGLGACWEWTGGVNGSTRTETWTGGYGYLRIAGRMTRVHRYVYRTLVEDPGPLLHHRCENRRCVRPNHLTPATAAENQQARYA